MRPKKDYRVARNGDSFRCYYQDEEVGSISAKNLVFYVARLKGKESKLVKNQLPSNTEEAVKSQKGGEAQA